MSLPRDSPTWDIRHERLLQIGVGIFFDCWRLHNVSSIFSLLQNQVGTPQKAVLRAGPWCVKRQAEKNNWCDWPWRIWRHRHDMLYSAGNRKNSVLMWQTMSPVCFSGCNIHISYPFLICIDHNLQSSIFCSIALAVHTCHFTFFQAGGGIRRVVSVQPWKECWDFGGKISGTRSNCCVVCETCWRGAGFLRQLCQNGPGCRRRHLPVWVFLLQNSAAVRVLSVELLISLQAIDSLTWNSHICTNWL